MTAESLGDYPVTGTIEGHVGPEPGKTIEETFWKFHEANPIVYKELVDLARRLKQAGRNRLSIVMLYEVVRYNYSVRLSTTNFKLNNNHRAYYARLIMRQEPDLVGMFETRKLHFTEWPNRKGNAE